MASFEGGFAQITVGATAVAIGSTSTEFDSDDFPAEPHLATIYNDGAAIRLRFDGGDPEAGMGIEVADGGTFTVEGAYNIRNLKAIRTAGVSSVVNVTLEVL